MVDPYHWLSNDDDPLVLAHLEAENAYTKARTEHLEPLAERLFDETRARIRETDVSVPARKDGWWYFSRTTAGQQYGAHCRVRDGGQLPQPAPGVPLEGEQVLLDGNVEAGERDFFELAGLEPDPAAERIAFLFDERGDERYDLVVRDIDTGGVLDDAVQRVGYGLVWSTDGRYLFYTRRDDAWRAHEVWRHEIGAPAEADVLIFAEPDELFNVWIDASADERWLQIGSDSRTTAEVHLVDLSIPTDLPRVVEPRTPGVDYGIEVDGDRVLVVHNAARVDFDLAWAPLATPGRQYWQPVDLQTGEGDRVLGVTPFASFTAVSMRHAGLATVRLLRRTETGYAPGPEIEVEPDVFTLGLAANLEYDAASLRVALDSYVVPRSTFEVDPTTGEIALLHQRDVPGYDPTAYTEERVWVQARDGVQVPVSLVRRREVTANGSNPGLIYGYGAYEIPSDPYFSAARLSLLDRGVVYAVAHVRGGGELGRAWYDDGKLLAKPNTFRDFVDCSRAIVDLGWVAPDRLAAEGGSAGGLLMGAVVNEAPELYRVVHAAVPFVDALSTILRPELPLTVAEWEEWGNPLDDPEVYACMRDYTPYENVRPVAYPTILATTSLHDTRVFVAEPAKWIQALRDTVTSDPATRPVLLKVEMGGGHGGASGRYDAWRQHAFEDAVILDALGAVEQADVPRL